MTQPLMLSNLLLVAAITVMLASVYLSFRAGAVMPESMAGRWKTLSWLATVFIAGCALYLAARIRIPGFPIDLPASVILLCGAALVFLVMKTASTAINRIKDADMNLGQANETLRHQNVVLEQEIKARRDAEAQSKSRLQHLATLHAIDTVITSSLDLRVTLKVFLDQLISQLQVHAAAVLLLNRHTMVLEYEAGTGFSGHGMHKSRERLGEGSAGRAAMERRIVRIENLAEAEDMFERLHLLDDDKFSSYFAVPLTAKGQVKGVLEIFHRSPLPNAPEWLDFLEALSVQAAIAIDNATLFNDLQRTNAELVLAYDTTIEGWSKALELRDQETEGHTQRVTEMTVRMARIFGMGEEEIVHVRRGALLHDIGKMAISDRILLNDGPLTPDEQRLMRQHPVYAFEMLSPITYLHPALVIPYCHHERWDGTGYPRGLKGQQIPLAARIFAVADNWDALVSNRRYHQAWSKEKVRAHIESLSGTHFDPKVVEAFLNIDW
ncbi:MAG: HD domain-containing protein [Nitrospirae bacterium]|nr:HD domain-containing protein [Nitrospirota bacterium]